MLTAEQIAIRESGSGASEASTRIVQPGWYPGMSESVYHSDPCETPSLSSSIASTLVTKSPWHAWRAHPRFGNVRTSSDAQDRGTIVHALVLGEHHRFAVLDVDDFRTKDARRQRYEAERDGLIAIKRAFYDECSTEADDVSAKLRERYNIDLAAMKVEHVAVWREGDVMCRARLDAWDEETITIYDVKTTRDASPVAIERSIRSYDYHLQQAAYMSAVERLHPRLAGRVKFVFLFIESDTNEVVPVTLDGMLTELGRKRWNRAVDAWQRCLRADKWPGYAPKSAIKVECSDWAMTADSVAEIELRERMEGI